MLSGKPSITSLTFNRSAMSFICTSTGGPATKVTWTRNETLLYRDDYCYKQTQTIVDTSTSTYDNILHSESLSDLVGSFTCTVQNSRGSDSMSASISGKRINKVKDPVSF